MGAGVVAELAALTLTAIAAVALVALLILPADISLQVEGSGGGWKGSVRAAVLMGRVHIGLPARRTARRRSERPGRAGGVCRTCKARPRRARRPLFVHGGRALLRLLEWAPQAPGLARRLRRAVRFQRLRIEELRLSDPALAGWVLGAVHAGRALGFPVDRASIGTLEAALAETGGDGAGEESAVRAKAEVRIWPGRLIGALAYLATSPPARRHVGRVVGRWLGVGRLRRQLPGKAGGAQRSSIAGRVSTCLGRP
ncbi:MAG: hypothetical protein AB1609_15640, partial [Bacillota bacterium]